MANTQYKTVKPRMTNVKRVFVAKGHAVPEDILDGVEVAAETTTAWEEKYGEATLNMDDIPTHFNGNWNYDVAELSNIQGRVSIEPEYSFDFPVEVVLPNTPLDHDDLTTLPLDVRQKLSANFECVKGTRAYAKLSSFGDSVGYFTIGTVTESSTADLSDCVQDLSSTLYRDGFIPTEYTTVGGIVVLPGDFDGVKASDGNVETQVRYAMDMLNPENWDIKLSAKVNYRMKVVPKIGLFAPAFYHFINGDEDENLTLFAERYSNCYIEIGKALSDAVAFEYWGQELGTGEMDIYSELFKSFDQTSLQQLAELGEYAFDNTVSTIYYLYGLSVDGGLTVPDTGLDLYRQYKIARGAPIHLKKVYMNNGTYDLETAQDVGTYLLVPGINGYHDFGSYDVYCPEFDTTMTDLLSLVGVSDAAITAENMACLVYNGTELDATDAEPKMDPIYTDIYTGQPAVVYIVLKNA